LYAYALASDQIYDMTILTRPDGQQLILATFNKAGFSENSFSIVLISADNKKCIITLNKNGGE
jgi:hypothetical protein